MSAVFRVCQEWARVRRLAWLTAMILAAGASCATSTDDTADADAAPGAGGHGAQAGSIVTTSTSSVGGINDDGGFGGAGGIATSCGDGKIEAPETCEAEDLGGRKCADFGLNPGQLRCNSNCQIVVTGCGRPENCNNGVDDDVDGAIDCLDTECASLAGCLDSCAAPQAVVLPTFDSKSTLGRPSVHTPSCSGGTGSEYIYEVTPTSSGKLGVAVSQWSGIFSVSVATTCGDAGTELGCTSDTTNHNFHESLQVDVVAGNTYFVMVDAASPEASGEFDVRIFMVESGESVCFDWMDEDADGLVDCNDPDCQTTGPCTDGSTALGAPCVITAQCSSADDDPICLPSFLGFSAGYCSERCDLSSNDCPANGQCFDYGIGADGVCLDSCITAGDCRSGYACVDLGLASRVCYIAPESDCGNFEDDDFDQLTDCDDPDCKTTQGCTPGTGIYGAACSANNQCISENGNDPLCLLSPPFFFTEGYCSEFCSVGAGDCGNDGVCHDWFFLDGSAGQCFRRCQTDTDCGTGTNCVDYGFGKHCNL